MDKAKAARKLRVSVKTFDRRRKLLGIRGRWDGKRLLFTAADVERMRR